MKEFPGAVHILVFFNDIQRYLHQPDTFGRARLLPFRVNPQAAVVRPHQIGGCQASHVAVADTRPAREQEHVPREITVGGVIGSVRKPVKLVFCQVHLFENWFLRRIAFERAEWDDAAEHGKHHHAFQAVDMSEYGPGHETPCRAHIHIKRLDKVFIQLLDRHIRHMVSLFQELTEYPAGVPVLVERACRPVHPYTQGIVAVMLRIELHDGVLGLSQTLEHVSDFLRLHDIPDVGKFVEPLLQQ